jgi:hypothetical protein
VGYGIVRAAIGHIDAGRYLLAAKILKSARPVTYGVPGQADLSGILGDGRRLEVELKAGAGKQRDQQKKYEEMIRSHRGIYILARSADEAEGKVKEVLDAENRSARLEDDLEQLEDYVRWLEYESSQGGVGLTRDMYDIAVMEDRWIPEEE